MAVSADGVGLAPGGHDVGSCEVMAAAVLAIQEAPLRHSGPAGAPSVTAIEVRWHASCSSLTGCTHPVPNFGVTAAGSRH